MDQLSLTQPNQTFIGAATTILEQAGFQVDYYSGEQVTVEFYRNLPTLGHSLTILRVHSTATSFHGAESPVTLFTSERSSPSKHVYEQLTDQLLSVAFSREEQKKGIEYFGISPLFVLQGMRGRFQNSMIIMMGCEGLDNPLMAEAFMKRGAKVYIGWSQQVSASHTDAATTRLLHHFLLEKRTVRQSIMEAFTEANLDPVYKSTLGYYPLSVGNQTMQDILGSPAMDVERSITMFANSSPGINIFQRYLVQIDRRRR